MDTKRLILAIVLSFAVLFLYQLVFVKKAPEPQGPGAGPGPLGPQAATTASPTSPGANPGGAPPTAVPQAAGEKTAAVPPQSNAAVSALAETKVTVSTSLYRAVWTNKGAVLESYRLRNHKDEKKEDFEVVPVNQGQAAVLPFALLE